jgi:hypothetical protein
MVDSLFGTELPLPAKLVVAFLVVLALIGATTWVIRRLGGSSLATSAARGRQPRLAVIDAAAVDGRRRLVLIRRDNVEHLVMIGGPSDMVIEQNIIRAVPVAPVREAAGPRLPAAEPPPQAPAEPTPRALAEAARPVASAEPPPRPPQPRAEPRAEPTLRASRPPQPAPQPRERSEAAGVEPPPRRPPLAETLRTGGAAPAPSIPGEAALAAEAPPPPAADASLTDMAQRLEAALKRSGQPEPAAENFGAAEETSAPSIAPAAELPPARTAESRTAGAVPPPTPPGRTDPRPSPQKSVFDSLEEEMANLLGRPAGKE